MCICSSQQENPFSYLIQSQIKQFIASTYEHHKKNRQNILLKILRTFSKSDIATDIFINGHIYTMDDNKPVVDAVATFYQKIIKVGSLQEVMKFKGEDTNIVDLQGRTMLPGFIDPHIHMCFCILDQWLNLGPFVNKHMNQIKYKIKQALKKANHNQLLCAQLLDPQITPGSLDISRKGLDELCGEIGVFILQANGHIAHVNSAALKLLGIDKNTPDPPHGRLMRDKDGQLTGQVQQMAVRLFKSKFPKISRQVYMKNFRNFLQNASQKGCTSLHDCGIGFIDPKADMSILYETFNNNPPVRYSGFIVSTQYQTWRQMNLKPNHESRDLRINGVKCWADGSTQGGSAYLRENYLVKKWGKGNPNYTSQQLIKTMTIANQQGWQIGVHCNGDAGIDLVLDCYEQVMKKNPKPELRHRTQHTTVCHRQQLQRMKKLSITPSFLIGHIYYYGQVFQQILGQQRAKLMDPVKSAIQLGLKPTLHSDYNCQPVDPLRCIYNAVTRKTRQTKKVINEKQCVSPYQAVQAMTINAAWQCHMQDIVGSIQIGKLADFVILQEDPLKIDPEKIIDIQINSTWMGGRRVYACQSILKQEEQGMKKQYKIEYVQQIMQQQYELSKQQEKPV